MSVSNTRGQGPTAAADSIGRVFAGSQGITATDLYALLQIWTERRGLLGGHNGLRDVLGFGGMAKVRDGWHTRLTRMRPEAATSSASTHERRGDR